jgi:hypothetical protein
VRVLHRKYLNVIDPANPFNNLGRSVIYQVRSLARRASIGLTTIFLQNAAKIRQAFISGAARIRSKLLRWSSPLPFFS